MSMYIQYFTRLIMPAAIILLLGSCKKDFDAPPAPTDPNITVTHTLKQLKALHVTGGVIDVITLC